MSVETSEKGPVDTLKRFWQAIIAILGVPSTIVSSIKLWQGDTGLWNFAFLILGTGSLLVILIYIYFKKPPDGRIIDAHGEGIKGYVYSKKARIWALTGIIAIPIFTTAGFFGWKYYQDLPSKKIVILIADFEGPDPKNYRVTENIVERLSETTKRYPDTMIQSLGQPITAQQGSEVAREKGKMHKASIVLWGWYGKTPEKVLITAHFEVLHEKIHLPLHAEKEILKVAIPEFDSFDVQERLSSEMNYLMLLALGLARFEAQDFDGAIELFDNALTHAVPEQMVHPAKIYFYRGSAFYFKGDPASAMADFGQFAKLQPNAYEAYNNLGLACLLKGDYNQAIVNLNIAIKLNQNNAEAYNNRGHVYFYKGDLDSAIVDFNQAIILNPSLVELYIHLGQIYVKKGSYDHAIANYSKAITLKPSYARTYYDRGRVYLERGHPYSNRIDLDSAIADFTQAVALEPKLAEAYKDRGHLFADRGEFDHAISDLDRAISLNPSLYDAYYNRGIVYAKKSNYNNAIADFTQSIVLEPSLAETYNARGSVYIDKGDFDLALSDFNESISLKSDNVDAYINRGITYGTRGNFDLAISDLNSAIALKPDSPLAYYNRGRAYRFKGNDQKAISDFKKTLTLTSRH